MRCAALRAALCACAVSILAVSVPAVGVAEGPLAPASRPGKRSLLIAQAGDGTDAPPADNSSAPSGSDDPPASEAPKEPATETQLPEIAVEQPAEAPPAPSKPTAPKPRPVQAEARPRPAPVVAAAPSVEVPTVASDDRAEGDTESTAPPATGTIGAPPPAFAGGQVATGGQVGLLGNRNIFDTPYSMTSYTAEAIQNQQATTIGAVLENNPSVRSKTWGGAWDSFWIRGFEVMTWAYSLNGLSGIAPAMVAPEMVERVELFLGPSGMLGNMPLFGATGGHVNLVTKKAYDAPLTELTTGYLSDGQVETHLDVGRRYGLNKEWGIRFNGVYREGYTAIDQQEEMLGLATVALDYHGKRVRTSLDIGYQAQDWNVPPMFLVYNGPAGRIPKAPKSGSNPLQPWSFSDMDDFFVAWQGEVDVAPNVTLFAAAGYLDNFNLLLAPYQEIEDRAGNTTVYPYYLPQTYENFTANAGLRTNFATGPLKHALRLGAQTQLSETGWYDTFYDPFASNIYDPVTGPRPFTAGLDKRPPRTGKFDISSLAVADTLSVLEEAIQVTLGVRRQNIKSDSYDAFTGEHTGSYDESAYTPTYGIVVKPWKKLSLYANYIEGLTEGDTAPEGTLNAGEVFPPFVSVQYEAGAKLDLGRLGLTAAAFEITEPSGFVDVATQLFVVEGDQRNRGLEFNAFGELTDTVRILGGVTLLEALLLRTGTGNDGNFAPGSPEVTVSLGSEVDIRAVPGLTLVGRVLYSSGQFYDPENTITLPDWTRVDLGARYETVMFGRDMVWRANVENVADSSYWASAAMSTLSLNAPRRFLLSATTRF